MAKRPSSERLPPLGDLEEAVLDLLWDVGEADVQDAHRVVGRKRRISVNTVGSALERLYKKGLLAREKVSHAYRYRPAMARDEFRATRVLEAAGGLSALSEEGVLSAFVDLVEASDESALDHLERLIAERRRAGSKGR
jgi:predicted transcriptional regulator